MYIVVVRAGGNEKNHISAHNADELLLATTPQKIEIARQSLRAGCAQMVLPTKILPCKHEKIRGCNGSVPG